ncbi:reverse transcriptase domain-containing protein [Tanacetum coccineum]
MPIWTLYTDGASGSDGSGAGLILTNPNGKEITYALRFDFPTSNNEAEYEYLIAGLELALRLEVRHLQIFTDSLLVTNHVKGTYEAREESMKWTSPRVPPNPDNWDTDFLQSFDLSIYDFYGFLHKMELVINMNSIQWNSNSSE